ncbi:hypothetical protein LB521_27605 [Mesorhizobium sp. BR-1-1-8]|uniref:hypothetical protein n=1 Tax=Mesorhizobium sp. BR-1-1-8 TaxID=2876659 RepID=UPI001CCFB1F3|nr:hypothetical protein [Mesorhizobium sp. BR-1-1-8]MBZ9984903.1 hypothetical protein [Mesorhizobium sp. BR-1-1-8]
MIPDAKIDREYEAYAKEMRRVTKWTAPANDNVRMCGCIGPQNGEPLCPCAMKGVRIENGRYVQIIDHGPANGGKRLEIAGAA